MRLYVIDQQIQALIDGAIDPETGELVLDPAELDALQMEREAKIENLAMEVKNLDAFSKDLKDEEDKFRSRRRVLENRAERIKGYIAQSLAGEKFTSVNAVINWRRTTSVKIDETVFLTSGVNRFIPGLVSYEPKISKDAVKRAINAGQAVEGAELVSSMSMSIK